MSGSSCVDFAPDLKGTGLGAEIGEEPPYACFKTLRVDLPLGRIQGGCGKIFLEAYSGRFDDRHVEDVPCGHSNIVFQSELSAAKGPRRFNLDGLLIGRPGGERQVQCPCGGAGGDRDGRVAADHPDLHI
jgi:hypothetical protein